MYKSIYQSIKKHMVVFTLIGGLLIGFSSGVWITNTYHKGKAYSDLQTQMILENQLNKALSEISRTTQESIANITVENRTIRQEVINSVTEVAIYNQCIIDTAVVNLLNKSRGH